MQHKLDVEREREHDVFMVSQHVVSSSVVKYVAKMYVCRIQFTRALIYLYPYYRRHGHTVDAFNCHTIVAFKKVALYLYYQRHGHTIVGQLQRLLFSVVGWKVKMAFISLFLDFCVNMHGELCDPESSECRV
jgi:hypothetical protein